MNKDYFAALEKLNENQRTAVDHLDGPLLVLAGPGTGKTQLLSTRVAHILASTDTNPENILCLTFTESGASNMRTRLSSLIGRPAAKVHISTYHAFGRQLLGAYANYAEIPPRLFDSPISNVEAYKIFIQILATLPSSDILKTAKIADLISVTKELKSARLSSEDIEKIASKNLEDSAGLNSEITPLLSKLVPRKFAENIPIYTEILEILTKYISDKPIVKSIEPEANHLARDLKKILDEAEKISPLSKWKDANFEKDEKGNYRLKNLIANKKLLSLANVLKNYQTALEKENLFDYADMIEQAIKYLKEDKGFRATLSETYQFILLDEFQDTNPSQFDLVKLLTDYENPNVMAVGDDDQAIMEFQGAAASNLLDFESHYKSRVITLTENYRSTQPILDFSRKIADQIEDSFSKAHEIEKNLTAANPSVTTQPSTIERHQFIASPSEYDWITTEVASLISAGLNSERIAIITPKHKYIPTLLPHLAAKNIPISYEKRENIFEDERIASLLLLARFISRLAEEKMASHLLLELLSAPYWGLEPLTAIEALDSARREKLNALTYLKNSPDEKLSTLASFFAELAVRSFDTPLELFLDYLTGSAPLNDFRSPFLAFYAKDSANYNTFSLYENLSVLKEALITHSKTEKPRLKNLIMMLDDYETANEPLINTSPYQTSESAVQIMSAHKAKGLEFSHVFLVSVDDAAWGNATGNNSTFTLPKNLAHVRHTGITEDERLRLFFVAITRAETHLYLTSSNSDFSGKSPAPLEYLEESDGTSPLLPEKTRKIIIHKNETPDPTPLKNHWFLSYKENLPDLTHILKRRLENYRLSPTDLTGFIDIVYAGPLSLYTKFLGAPHEPATPTMAYGNFIHAVLDHATKNKSVEDPALLSLYETLVNGSDMTDEEKSELLEKGTTNLPKILKKFGKNLRTPSTLSEIDFRPDHIVLGDVPVTGKIDQLLIDKESKTIAIVDFKTSAYDPKKTWKNNPTLYKYRLQLGFYKLLLNNSPKYRSYRVETALLEHLTPNPHGDLGTRPYDFPPADEEELKSLIEVVYKSIKSLNFPEIPPDADRTLKDIKTFVSDLLS